MSAKVTSDLWWKDAVLYCLDVETFYDADGDGCGDLVGLTQRIDYLAGIGVSCLWLMPFYTSPNRDDGYDIVDYYAVDPKLGTFGDLTELIRTARDRGMRVIADFVMNHTSDQHPWFQAARESRDSPYRDFYVWSDEKPEEKPGDVVFPDKEDSNWEWDEQAGQYYLHRFYSHQPDLNMANPQVRDELAQVMGFWLAQGLSGFRVDAVPFMIEPTGLPEGAIVDPHELLRDLRRHLNRRDGEAVLLGEVNLPPKDVRAFLGDEDGDELHMVLDFLGNQALYLALARGDAATLAGALRAMPELPEEASLGRFVRNHDELTLDKLSDSERQEVFARFGPDQSMQLYGRGHPPPAADHARRRPARDPHGRTRWPSRCPARRCSSTARRSAWARTSTSRAGWPCARRCSGRPSATAASRRWRIPSSCGGRFRDGPFGPEHVNVAAQRRDPQSLLSWFERLVRRRRECPELGFGTLELLETGEPSVFAHRCDWEGSTIVAVHELAGREVEVTVPVEDGEALVDLFAEAEHPLPATLSLAPYAAHWFRVRRKGVRMPP